MLARSLSLPDVPPTGDSTLDVSDIRKINEELFDVRAKWKLLGLVLGLPKSTVDGIHKHYEDQADQLRRVIAVFLEQKEPRPTWMVIVKALRSPLINENALARKIEERYSSTQFGE